MVFQIGVLVPLTRPGWTEAGRHLLAGLELATGEVNDTGGIRGRRLELVVRDTAADPDQAVAAVRELAARGVAALAGEYHSVVARAAAAVAAEPSVYWASGTRILQGHLSPSGGRVTELSLRALDTVTLCDHLAGSGVTVILLLAGYPEPIVPLVRAIRADQRLAGAMIGAPAGQPEFAGWLASLGADGAGIPFLRYLPGHLGPLGARVEAALRERLAEPVSFVGFEGYDTIMVLADLLRAHGQDQAGLARSWPLVAVEGTRGRIRFSRQPGISVWQWAWAPVQVADRDPAQPERFRVLGTA
jgi:ABC-type branched-subunit amino acid transport system substrate-binding protein